MGENCIMGQLFRCNKPKILKFFILLYRLHGNKKYFAEIKILNVEKKARQDTPCRYNFEKDKSLISLLKNFTFLDLERLNSLMTK